MSQLKVCVDRVQSLPLGADGRMVLDPAKMWRDPEDPRPDPVILEVGFLDDDHGLRNEIRAVASEWSKYANVELAFSDRPAEGCDIRISFRLPGAWSYLGTDSRDVAGVKPTMNFGWLTEKSPQAEIRRVVLHEFGHALGCAHEHFHPGAGIPWNTEKVYQWYQQHYGWDRTMVDDQVLFRYDKTLTVHSEFDRQSIMLYPIDPALTDGVFHTDMNLELSDVDKAFIAQVYPRPAG